MSTQMTAFVLFFSALDTRRTLDRCFSSPYFKGVKLHPDFMRYSVQDEDKMNEILAKCYMGDLNVSNPYEAFVLMCLLTSWPMAAFSEVWERSYEGAQ